MNENEENQGYSIAALVLGICSLVLWSLSLIDIACGVLAVVFGSKGMKLAKKGLAKAGFIMGIVSLSIWAATILLGIVAGTTIISLFSSMV